MFISPPLDPTLEELLEKARLYKMTPEEKRAQRVSFAYGNAALYKPDITKEMVKEADKELHPEDYPPKD